MRAGKLRERIVIEQKTVSSQTARGAEVVRWVKFARVWAGISPLRGAEFVALLQAGEALLTRFTIRYIPGITADMRIVHRGDVYELVEPPINAQTRDKQLELLGRANQPVQS